MQEAELASPQSRAVIVDTETADDLVQLVAAGMMLAQVRAAVEAVGEVVPT